jgi:N-methylhydantoinase A
MRVGVDIGGTFTDVVLERDGQLHIHKLPSTPADPSLALLAGMRALTDEAAVTRLAHGTTVATNAILERKGARVAFITTGGLRDLLVLGRQHRPDVYALHPTLPPPLVPRDWCYEVPERLDFRGEVLTPLDVAAVDRVLAAAHARGAQALAVCLLYGHINPTHEHAIRQRALDLKLFDHAQIALSSDVLPQFREFERASTTVLEAYVRPIVNSYISNLAAHLPPTTTLHIMKSDGGVMRADGVAQRAVHTALSGPAAGVLGAFHLAKLAGFPRIITLDMGGTSTDVALCDDALPLRPESAIDGLPLRIRTLNIETVGAGGGSLARADAGGVLRVGPQSAAAIPGPMAYGRGGTYPTVTDAHVLADRLAPAHFLGGQMALDRAAAERGIAALAAKLGLSSDQTAHGILALADAHTERAIRRVSVAQGYDPRDFTLVAFGGAGPLHACTVAARLGMVQVLIPPAPGVLCAYGLLVADVVIEYTRPVMQTASAGLLGSLRAQLGQLATQAYAELGGEGLTHEAVTLTAYLDLRYAGQGHELTVPFLTAEGEKRSRVLQRFQDSYHATYGYTLPDRAIEVTNLRLQAVGAIAKPASAPKPVPSMPPAATPLHSVAAQGSRPAYHVYDRAALSVGAQLDGQALIVQLDSTTFVPQGWRARVDGYGNLLIAPSARR